MSPSFYRWKQVQRPAQVHMSHREEPRTRPRVEATVGSNIPESHTATETDGKHVLSAEHQLHRVEDTILHALPESAPRMQLQPVNSSLRWGSGGCGVASDDPFQRPRI